MIYRGTNNYLVSLYTGCFVAVQNNTKTWGEKLVSNRATWSLFPQKRGLVRLLSKRRSDILLFSSRANVWDSLGALDTWFLFEPLLEGNNPGSVLQLGLIYEGLSTRGKGKWEVGYGREVGRRCGLSEWIKTVVGWLVVGVGSSDVGSSSSSLLKLAGCTPAKQKTNRTI